MKILEQDGLEYPETTPDIIVEEAKKCVPCDGGGIAYGLVENLKSDVLVYSMLVSEDFIMYMYTFYNNQNYDDNVSIKRVRL